MLARLKTAACASASTWSKCYSQDSSLSMLEHVGSTSADVIEVRITVCLVFFNFYICHSFSLLRDQVIESDDEEEVQEIRIKDEHISDDEPSEAVTKTEIQSNEEIVDSCVMEENSSESELEVSVPVL